MNRITALAAGHSECKNKQTFNTDITGVLIKCQQTNFTFEISYSPKKNFHTIVISLLSFFFGSKRIKLIFHEWTHLAQKYSYIKHHNTKHYNDTITDNTETSSFSRTCPLFDVRAVFLIGIDFRVWVFFLFPNTFANYNVTKKTQFLKEYIIIHNFINV